MDYKSCEEYVLGELEAAQNENELLKQRLEEMMKEIQSLREETSDLRSEIVELRRVIKKMSASQQKDILDEADELLESKWQCGDTDGDKVNPYYEHTLKYGQDLSDRFKPFLVYTDGVDSYLKEHFNLGEIEEDLDTEQFKEFVDEFLEGYKRNKKRVEKAKKDTPAKEEK